MIVQAKADWSVQTQRGDFTFKRNKEYLAFERPANTTDCKCKKWYTVWFNKERNQKAIVTSKSLFNEIFRVIRL